MAKRHELVMVVDNPDRVEAAVDWARNWLREGLAGGTVQLAIGRPRRSLDQNAKLWPMLQDIARQVDWYGERLSKEEWKDVLTAGLKKQKVVPGVDGGFVVVGLRTSRMCKKDFCELVEFIYWFGAERGVRWSTPKRSALDIWQEKRK